MKIMFDFKLRRIERLQISFSYDALDLCLGRILIAFIEEREFPSVQEVRRFLEIDFVKKLQKISADKLTTEVYEIARNALLQALQVLGPVNETQRRLID